jgi:hypothetical protein
MCLAVAPAQAATADYPSPCTYANFEAPARLSFVGQWLNATSPLHNDCTSPFLSEKFSAMWGAVATNGAVVDEVFYHTTGDATTWDEDPAINVEDTIHLGRWSWRPESGFTDIDLPGINETLTLQEMNSPTSDVRVGSSGTVSATRHGGLVTLRSQSKRYWTSTHAFGRWAKAVGVIQYRVPGTATWHNLKNVSADGYGRYVYTYRVSSRRDYRVIAFDTAPYIWGSVSSGIATA